MTSTSPPDDLSDALKQLPLFPLRQAVLFPRMLLPLHVFEPRYRHMVRDVLASHRSFAVAYVPDVDADMSGNPPIAEIAGVGTIVEYSELPGGRFDILVRGRARVRLQELRFVEPYRRALATLLESRRDDVAEGELAALHTAAAAFAAVVRGRDPSFKLRVPADASAGALADACASALLLDARERQAALQMLDVRERVRHVTEILMVQRAALAPEQTESN